MSDSSDSEVAETQEQVEVRRGAVRAGYRDLLDTIAREEDDLVNIEAGAGQLTELMRDNENLYTQVEAPQEAVMDAMVIRHLSRLCRQQAEQLSANINQFRQEEYVERLKAAMRVDPGSNLSRRKWVLLGRRASVLFKKSPYLTSMLGSLDIAPPPPKVKKLREKATKGTKQSELKETQATVLAERSDQSENATEQMVKHVNKCLVSKFKEGGRKPVCYFSFVLDPTSFGISVENMFYVSFLINEKKASVSMSASGLPELRPVSSKESGNASGGKNQVVANFTMNDWRKFVGKLGISQPSIAHL